MTDQRRYVEVYIEPFALQGLGQLNRLLGRDHVVAGTVKQGRGYTQLIGQDQDDRSGGSPRARWSASRGRQ
ncbi:MAG: hypothetical protein AAF654_07650 [Myxococcota bacterium]